MKIVKHKKRGTFYRVIGNATLQCAQRYQRLSDLGETDIELDGQQWRLYQSLDDGSFHVRPQGEFEDGRFVADTSTQGPIYSSWGKEALMGRIAELERAINTPHTDEFFLAVRMEAAHQVERWGTDHDEGKSPADWLFLVGHLASKACTYETILREIEVPEYLEKTKHHIISSAAALLNWWRAVTGDSNAMRPGIKDPA